jgi:hypothetical protein
MRDYAYMISDRFLQRFSSLLCIASVIASSLLLLRVIDFSILFAFLIQGGLLFTGFVLTWGSWSSSYRWDGSIPRMLRIVLPVIAVLGVCILIFGFLGVMPAKSPSGEPVHHLNAYFVQGKCFAVFNESRAIEMPSDFCKNFSIHFAAGFCGLWLFFSALLHWASLKRRTSGNQKRRKGP